VFAVTVALGQSQACSNCCWDSSPGTEVQGRTLTPWGRKPSKAHSVRGTAYLHGARRSSCRLFFSTLRIPDALKMRIMQCFAGERIKRCHSIRNGTGFPMPPCPSAASSDHACALAGPASAASCNAAVFSSPSIGSRNVSCVHSPALKQPLHTHRSSGSHMRRGK